MERSNGLDAARPETVPAGSASARWIVIAAQLRDDVASGNFRPGERLPNETVLAERFQVNRHTLRQAMQQLAREGHVSVVQGRGTFVRELVLDYALRRRTRMTTNLASLGERAEREILSHRVAPVAGHAKALRLAPRTPAEWIATRASVRGRVVSLSTAVFPLPRFRGMSEVVQRAGGITAALRDFGVADYTRSRSMVSARLPSQAEADALARSTTQPLLIVQYTNVDMHGVPIEAGTTLFAADAVQLSVEPEDFDR